MANLAIETAWADLRSKFVGDGPVAFFNSAVGNTIIPRIDVNPDNYRMFLKYADKLFNDELFSRPPAHRMKLVCNERLYKLLTSLPLQSVNDDFNLGRSRFDPTLRGLRLDL